MTAKVYTPKEAQGLLKLSRMTIYKMLWNRELKGKRAGRSWRIPQKEIEKFTGPLEASA